MNRGSFARACPTVTLFAAALIAAGCAMSPAPTDQLALSEAVIAEALRAGAAELAPGELKSAQEKMALAKRWIAARDYKPARWLAEQAHVDAQFATTKAISANAFRIAIQETEEHGEGNRMHPRSTQ